MRNNILSRVKLEKYTIYYDSECGPSFGYGLVMHGNDFYSKRYCKKYSCYEKPMKTEIIFRERI
jgi:hypothetical protein